MFGLGKFSLSVFAVILIAVDGSDGIQPEESGTLRVTARIEPSQPLIWSGGFIILSCNLSGSHANVTAYDINLYSSNPEINDKIKKKVVNDRTIRANLTDIHRNMSSENISCRFGNTSLDEVTLLVADRPQCMVMNWESMICTWEKFQLNYEANFSLIYSRSYDTDKWFRCPRQNGNSCQWDSSEDRDRYFEADYIVAMIMNVSGKIQPFPETIKFTSGQIVKPNPVPSFHSINTIGNHSILLNWTSAKESQPLNYRVTWTSEWSDVSVANTTTTMMLLKDLIPHTVYMVTIDCIPVMRNKEVSGFWSDPKRLNFTTTSDVPGASPNVSPGGYIETLNNASHRLIELFFQPLDKRLTHGQIKQYKVKYSPREQLNTIFEVYETKTSLADVWLRKDVDYMFTVEAENERGYNTTLIPQPIVISSQTKKPLFPKNFVVKADDDSTYFFNWFSVTEASSYTLYWCNSNIRQFSCVDDLKWKTVTPNQTSMEMKLIGLPDRTLLFFISVEKILTTGELVSSGMLINNCTYSKNGELKPPIGFRVSQSQSASSLIAEWSQPDETTCQRRAYPAHYVIVYCSMKSCYETNATIEVNSSAESVEITGLEPSNMYRIAIKSVSSDGRESDFVQANETTAAALEDNRGKPFVFILVSTCVATIFISLCVVLVCVKCQSWLRRTFNVVVPNKYFPTDTGIKPEQSYYSNSQFGSSSPGGKNDTVVIVRDDACPAVNHVSETQTLLLKENKLSTASSCYTNETSLQSSSSQGSSKSDMSERCWNSDTAANSGTSLPNSDDLAANNLVFSDSTV